MDLRQKLVSCPEGAIQLFCDCLIDYIDTSHTENLITHYSVLGQIKSLQRFIVYLQITATKEQLI